MCKRLIFLTSVILVLGLVGSNVASATTVWNPAANGIVPPATGNWGDAANWTNGLPDAVEKAVFNVPDAAECVVTDAQSTRYFVQGDNGPGGVVRVQNGGHLSQTEPHWAAVGYNDTAHMIVEAGGQVDFSEHAWIGFNAGGVGTLDINGGVVTVAQMFGLGWEGGDGYVNVNDGGLLALSNIHGDGVTSIKQNSLLSINGTGRVTLPGDFVGVIDAYAAAGLIAGDGVLGAVQAVVADDVTTVTAVHPPISVATVAELEAAAAAAVAGDTIVLAEGTYMLTSQVEIKDGVTYQGAGSDLTIIDGNNVTRAFVAWGDCGATDGQVDANGISVPNATGPKNWVLDGMTIQNCVADTEDRHDILSAARDLLNNYTGTPYTLVAAQAENGDIEDNPGWFDILSGSADDDLTDVELQAYLDGNPVGSAGHLVVNDDQSGDGGAITIDNQAVGTIQNCEFLNNHTPIPGDGDDGGAINITGLSVVTINDCLFDGNYACSPTSVAEADETGAADGDGGHIKVQGSSASAITPGTTLIANRCIFLNGNASDDGGAIQSAAVGTVVRLDSCWFEGNTSWDNGNVCQFSNNAQNEVTVTNCIFVNNITKADNGPDRMIETNRNSKFINCIFVGNNQFDEDMIYNNANTQDTNGDGVDDETADTTQVINCIFANNVVGNGDDVLGSRDASFTIAATNCLFFGNTLQNGKAADNTQRPELETGSVLADPLLDANYAPGAGSPAIDAGVDPATVGVTLTTDFNGAPRPQGAGYDIGAFESPAN